MKKFTTLKTLLVGLLVLGATSVWARTITYDFKSAVDKGGITESSLTKGTNAGKNNSADIFYPVELTSELQNRFAFQYKERNSNTNAWAVVKSRGGLWSNCASGNDDYFSILNLKAGDIVKVTIESGEIYFSTTEANATYDNEGTTVTPAQWEVLVSEREYAIKADGKLDLQAKRYQNNVRGHCVISKIEISTSDEETIETAPIVTVTGANGGAREITITTYNTSLGNPTTAYYTLDGTDPTASNTEYSAAFNVSSADDTDADGIVVVKAISYKTGASSIASSVTTLNVPVGTTVSLNAPVVTITSFTANGGVLNPTYSFNSNQSNVIGSPDAKLTYSFNGGTAETGSSFTPSATGTLRVTASAEGYDPVYTEVVVNCVEFLKTYVFDPTKDISVKENATPTYDNYTINQKGCRLYALSDCEFSTSKSISFDSNMQFAWAITANEPYCLFARLNKSTISYNLADGELIEILNNGAPIIASSETTSTQLAWYSSVYKISVYTPAANVTISTTIGSNGFATFACPYDVEIPSGITAYTAKVNDEGTAVKFTKIEGTAIPANTGVLLEGTSGEITFTVAASASPLTDNDFIAGAGKTITAAENTTYFAMVKGSNPLKFAKVDPATVAIPTDKAYLAVATGAMVPETARLTVTFDGEATAIKSIENANADKSIYNLNGQRVAKAKKGLYIVNGKKTIVK